MDGFLHLGIEILHAHGGAVKTDFAQSHQMIAGQAARVHFHAGFNVRREGEVFVDDLAEPANFIRPQKRGRAAAEMELDGLAPGIQQRSHPGDLTLQIIDVVPTLVMVQGDDRGATAKPAERFAKGNVKVNRQVAGAAVIGLQLAGELVPAQRVAELGGRRIAGVTRPGHVVLLHQIQINFERAHDLNL